MNSIGQITSKSTPFFVEAFASLKNRVMPQQQTASALSLQSYDNRGKLADFFPRLRSRMERLQTGLSANSFLAESFSWNNKMALVSERDKVLASASDTAEEKEYSLAVTRLARSRSAVSQNFASSDTTELEAGLYSFDFTVGNQTYSLDVTIDKTLSAPDSNRDVLRKIQSAIAGKDENIEALVSEGKVKDFNPYAENVYKKISSLEVRSRSAGEEVAFSLQDTSGDLIQTLGLDKIRSYGRNSQYSLNGSSTSSESNTLSLGDSSLTAVLLGETVGSNVSIKVEGGAAAIEKELTDIITEYNNLLDWMDENKRFVSSRLRSDMFSDINSFSVKRRSLLQRDDADIVTGDISSVLQVEKAGSVDRLLEGIGLGLNLDGRIDMSDDFGQALVNDLKSVHDVLAGDNGFFTKIGSAIETILNQSGSRYLEEKSYFLTYDARGETGRDIYSQGATQLLNLYA